LATGTPVEADDAAVDGGGWGESVFGSMWPGAGDKGKKKGDYGGTVQKDGADGGGMFDLDGGGFTSGGLQTDDARGGFDVDSMGAAAGSKRASQRGTAAGGGGDVFDLDSGGVQATGAVPQTQDTGFDVDSMGGGGGVAAASRRSSAAEAYAATVARASREGANGGSALAAVASVAGQVHDARAVGDHSDEEEEFHF
jgi:hypothetical protein